MLRVNIQEQDGTAVLRCAGRIVTGAELLMLQDKATAQLERGALALELQHVDAIDAGGIGLLLRLRQRAITLGRSFQLLEPSPEVRAALAAVKLLPYFEVLHSAVQPQPDPSPLTREASAA